MAIRISTLGNGIKVITERMDGVRSISLGCWFTVGSRDETVETNGISHFMEHMRFKDTNVRTAAQISIDFDSMGAEFNAFTSKETTCFYARFVDNKLDQALDLLSDMLTNAAFTEENISSEREVVIEEIARSEDEPDSFAVEQFAKAMLPTHMLGKSIAGPRETVATFTREHLLAHAKHFYVCENLCIAAAGNVDHDSLCADVQKYFAALPHGNHNVRDAVSDVERKKRIITSKPIEQAHVVYGMPAIPAYTPERYASALFELAFGGGMSSRLFQEVREKRGLVYSIFGSSVPYQGYGNFIVYAGTRPDNIAELLTVVDAEAKKFASEGISEQEFKRVKDLVLGQLILGMESTRSRMNRLGKTAALDGPILEFDETIEKYNAVTIEEVNAVANRVLNAVPTVSIVSPFEVAQVEKILDSVGM